MSLAHFPTITGAHWAAMFARARAKGAAEGDSLVAQIRAAVAKKFPQQGGSEPDRSHKPVRPDSTSGPATNLSEAPFGALAVLSEDLKETRPLSGLDATPGADAEQPTFSLIHGATQPRGGATEAHAVGSISNTEPRCPVCNSDEYNKRHHAGSFHAPEGWWHECYECGHQSEVS